MILSRRHNFVFIKGRKVAGTSVHMALSTICGPDDIVSLITPRDERARLEMGGRPRNVANPADEERYIRRILAAAPDALDEVPTPRVTFAAHTALADLVRHRPEAADMPMVFVERNPYAKLLSRANHLEAFPTYRTGGEMRATLEQLRRAASAVVSPEGFTSVHNIELYRRGDGSIVGRQLRYEHLAEDLASFVHSLGIDPAPPLPVAKLGHLSNRFDPRDFFSRAQLDAINEAFADEFAAFGYEVL